MISAWSISNKNSRHLTLYRYISLFYDEQNKTVMFVKQGKTISRALWNRLFLFQTTITGFGHPRLISLKSILYLFYQFRSHPGMFYNIRKHEYIFIEIHAASWEYSCAVAENWHVFFFNVIILFIFFCYIYMLDYNTNRNNKKENSLIYTRLSLQVAYC